MIPVPQIHDFAFILLCHSNEGLRLFPAVPSGSQRAPEVGKGAKIVGP